MKLIKKLDEIFISWFVHPLAAVWRDNNPLMIRLSHKCINCVNGKIPECNATECGWRYSFYYSLKREGKIKMKLFKAAGWHGRGYEEAGLYDVCEWWIETYPDDIFVKEPKEVVEIRNLMKKILEKRKP